METVIPQARGVVGRMSLTVLFPATDFVTGSTGLWSFGLTREMVTCTSLSLVCDALEEPWATVGGPPRRALTCRW